MEEKGIKLNTTQQRVFDYMVENGFITTLDAWDKIGESRLSARIYELIHKGVNVKSETIEVRNRYGEKRHVKQYFL